jgi:hypothetical protein
MRVGLLASTVPMVMAFAPPPTATLVQSPQAQTQVLPCDADLQVKKTSSAFGERFNAARSAFLSKDYVAALARLPAVRAEVATASEALAAEQIATAAYAALSDTPSLIASLKEQLRLEAECTGVLGPGAAATHARTIMGLEAGLAQPSP